LFQNRGDKTAIEHFVVGIGALAFQVSIGDIAFIMALIPLTGIPTGTTGGDFGSDWEKVIIKIES